MSYHKHLLRGAVLAFSGLLMVGCSGSSQNAEESLTSDSKPIESISVNLSETPGDWLEALRVDKESIKETNDFHVTTVSGECYFSSETVLSRNINEDEDPEKDATKHVSEDNNGDSSSIDTPAGSKPSDEDSQSENELSYRVKSNEGELEFVGSAKQDSIAVKTQLGDGSKIQLIYGCNKGIIDSKKHLESKLDEMISLVDIKIERNNG